MSDINRRIAEAQGWRIVPYEDDTFTHLVANADGIVDYLTADDLDDAWRRAFTTDNYAYSIIPDYAHDLNAIMALFVDLRYVHEHFPEGLPHNRDCTDRVSIRLHSLIVANGEASTTVEAFSEAWLALHEAEQAG